MYLENQEIFYNLELMEGEYTIILRVSAGLYMYQISQNMFL